MRKQILSFILTLAMVLSLFSGLSLTTSAATYVDGGNFGTVNWELDSDGVLTLSGTGVVSYGPFMQYRNDILSVVVEDGITGINSGTFSQMSSITAVSLAGSVTSIGSNAFSYCTGLTSVTLSEGLVSIEGNAFYGCNKLEEIVIPEGVTSIGSNAFWSCSALASVTLPDTLNSIGLYAFYLCSALTEIDIPQGVTSIGSSTFDSCTALTSVSLPNTLTSIGDNAFKNCNQLTEIAIPGSVKTIGSSAFQNCSALTSVTLAEGLETIKQGAFASCTALTAIDIPSTVSSIGGNAFNACTGLTSAAIYGPVTTIPSGAFMGCSSLSSLTLPASLATIDGGVFYGAPAMTVYYMGTETQWTSVNVNGGNDSVVNATFHYNFTTMEEHFTVETVAPTCTEQGYTEKSCDCYEEVSRYDYKDALGHDIVSHDAQEATCTEVGWNAYEACSRCDYTTYQEVDALGHTAQTVPAVAATCTATGLTEGTKCSVCGGILSAQEETTALGHDYAATVTAPTCTDAGFTTYTCSRCDDSYVDDNVDALGHDLSYTNNGDDHTATCSRCDYSVTETHTFTDGSCVCGATEAQLQILSAALVLNGKVDVKFDVQVPNGYTDAYMVINGETIDTYTENSNGTRSFVYTGIHPQCFGDNIEATLYATKNGEEESVSVQNFSVRQYCVNMLAREDVTGELRTLLSDMLAYGAAAQTFTNYKLDSLVNTGNDIINPTYSTFTSLSGYAASFEGTAAEDTCWISAGLTLTNSVAMNIRFYAESIENLSVKVTINGRETSFTEFVAVDGKPNLYELCFDGINAEEFADTVTATFWNGEEQIGNTLSYSVNAYIQAKQNNEDANLQALVKALYNYGNAAKTYQNP